VPVLAALTRARGAKFTTLVRTLGVGRESLRRTLEHLVARGWVRRNPGHGHPLRPEYVPTAAGRRLGAPCDRLVRTLRRLGAEDVALRKWSLPVALALGHEARRFSRVRARLGDITDRALALALRALEEADLVDRRLLDERPPRAAYRLTRRARPLVPILESLEEARP
jgi:DNA-binding HxlR family transcriptional regulator